MASSTFSNPACLVVVLLTALFAGGCAPAIQQSRLAADAKPQLTDQAFIASDSARLPLTSWPAEHPKAVLIALHGFNDYRRFFNAAGDYLRQQQVYCYAYDQRGFGESANTGIWAGSENYSSDLAELTALLRDRHPGLPVYWLGESMGGAVVIDAVRRANLARPDGIILSAPAVWGRKTMPWYQTSLLWTLSHTLPWLTLTGKGLQIMPSDNVEMLRALGRDPLVIKETRVDAIYGLTNLMDDALDSAPQLNANTLLLYGKKDEIIPPEPTQLFVQNLLAHQPDQKTIALYDNGYHMLLRDLQAPLIWNDIARWILDHPANLPSGADRNGSQLVRQQTPGNQEQPG